MRIVQRVSLGVFFAALAVAPARAESVARNASGPDVKALDQGPVHEAFAQPNVPNPIVPPAIDKEPPAPVPEIPPEQRPEGDNVQWIPGYWAWDEERKDFIWVSGTYRDIPAGRTYVPGYWTRTEEGWRWVPGYFAPEQQAENPQYVPTPPPASLDIGPNVPAPDDGSLYVPGNWAYREGDFLWQPGYWTANRPGFIWMSPQYLWTPGGWIFCNGYWDYPFNRRGLLFAPVAFGGGWGPGWSYRPRYVVNNLLNGLFWRAGQPFYRYGSYFGPNYARQGFRPWFDSPWRADPVVGYYRGQNRGNPDWLAGVQRSYQNIGPGRAAPRITSLANLTGNDVRLSTQSTQQLARQTANAQAIRQASEQRRRVETRARSGSSTPRVANAPARPPAAGPNVRSGPPRQDMPVRSGKQGSNLQPSAAVRNTGPATTGKSPSPRAHFAETRSPSSRPATPRAVPQAQPRNKVVPSSTGRTYAPRTTSQPRYPSRPSSTVSRSPAATSYRPAAPSYRPSTSAYRSSPSFSRSGVPSGGRSGASFGSRGGGSFGGRGGGRR